MKVTFVLAVAAAITLAACDGSENPAATGAMAQRSTAASTTRSTASTSTEGPSCAGGLIAVSAQANIFGSGTDSAPGPGGEGGGMPPPSWQLPAGTRVLTFGTVTGKVTAMASLVDPSGPGGDGEGATDVTSYGGISGIVDRRNGMFLVGVFLTDDPPAPPAPKRLDFTKREWFRTLAPEIAQTFFIGDGSGRSFRVPRGATRLFLGFADAYTNGHFYQGQPGFYANNGGHVCVEIKAAKH